MSSFGRILVGIDPRATSLAVAQVGARLAEQLGAALELFSPVYNPHVSLAHFATRESMEHARDSLCARNVERLLAAAPDLGFAGHIEAHAVWDHPFEEALIRRVLERAANLLVVALPGQDDPRGGALSAVHWQLVRHCPAPVLLTHGKPWRDSPVIVASIDPTQRHGRREDLDAGILRLADQFAARTGGTLHAFHAWQRKLRAFVGEAEHPLMPDFSDPETEQRHREAVYAALASADASPARVALVEGRPEATLPEYCRENGAELVVMGAIARNPFGRVFIGSTAERVLDRLPCDLLVVKPDDFQTAIPRERWPRDDGATILGVPGI